MQVGITGGCESARVYRTSAARKYGLIAALIAMYALVLPMCYNTAGEPRAAAFVNSFSKYGEKWEAWEADEDAAMAEDAILSIWGMRAREDARQRRESPEQAAFFAFSVRSRDDRLAAASYREFRQFVFETFRVDGEPSLPPAYLPSALACLSLFCALTLHGACRVNSHDPRLILAALTHSTPFSSPCSAVPPDVPLVVVVQGRRLCGARARSRRAVQRCRGAAAESWHLAARARRAQRRHGQAAN